MSLNPSRPSSSELMELHVFYVPEGSWNYKLNTISIEVANKFISAGFIRQVFLSPQLTLQALRLHLGEFLGEDAVAEKFLFLKCIGNNLAVVKEKQESQLKLKSFAPPYALQPELYLLPVMDHFGNVYSASSTVTLDGLQTNNDITEINGTIQRPVSVTLSKEEPGRVPSSLENILKELFSKNQEEGEKIIEQMEQVKEERRYLERIREELIKKVEKLFEQNKLKRYQACDGWKKKYFEAKKITASLEEILTKLREDLELYYKKLLMQLEAREIKMKPKNLANIADSKVLLNAFPFC
ncbi:Spermatogenesis-associated protein 1 [Fukomys damarensis]|uniref:Spermatogenesis-associated protein 1 n=1 Tax=Fukomys damarensis TaxID=885580 RepID=A0A091DC22_FUKDA|nr:Spermatogenesis-associated protein 1 [Fukomys damarensis]